MTLRRSKLDTTSIVLIAVALSLFLIAAACYLIGIVMLAEANGGEIPRFTFTEIGNFAGILGMLIVPLFVVVALIQTRRENKRDQTGKDIDTNPKRGAAGRS